MSWEMPAKEAFKFARVKLTFKSSNKDGRNWGEERKSKYQKASGKVDQIHKWTKEQIGNGLSIKTYAETVLSHEAGNCGDYAVVALYHLRKEGGATAENSCLVNLYPFDHAFTQVGLTPTNVFPIELKKWGEAWIVDAWANICCAAKDFEAAFTEKMNGWDESNKWIGGARSTGRRASAWGLDFPGARKSGVLLPWV